MQLKRLIPFLTGASSASVIDWALQHFYEVGKPGTIGKFPWVTPHYRIPPFDDWIPLLTSGAIYGLGYYAKNDFLKDFGLG